MPDLTGIFLLKNLLKLFVFYHLKYIYDKIKIDSSDHGVRF